MNDTETAPRGHVFVAVGPNCWGKGETRELALQRARVNFPRSINQRALRKYFVVKCAPSDVIVNPMDGSVEWPADHGADTCPYCEVGKKVDG